MLHSFLHSTPNHQWKSDCKLIAGSAKFTHAFLAVEQIHFHCGTIRLVTDSCACVACLSVKSLLFNLPLFFVFFVFFFLFLFLFRLCWLPKVSLGFVAAVSCFSDHFNSRSISPPHLWCIFFLFLFVGHVHFVLCICNSVTRIQLLGYYLEHKMYGWAVDEVHNWIYLSRM